MLKSKFNIYLWSAFFAIGDDADYELVCQMPSLFNIPTEYEHLVKQEPGVYTIHNGTSEKSVYKWGYVIAYDRIEAKRYLYESEKSINMTVKDVGVIN